MIMKYSYHHHHLILLIVVSSVLLISYIFCRYYSSRFDISNVNNKVIDSRLRNLYKASHKFSYNYTFYSLKDIQIGPTPLPSSKPTHIPTLVPTKSQRTYVPTSTPTSKPSKSGNTKYDPSSSSSSSSISSTSSPSEEPGPGEPTLFPTFLDPTESTTESPTTDQDDYYDDDYPVGIYTNKDGRIVIASDNFGNVYRSNNYGEYWEKINGVFKSKGKYGYITTLVMTDNGGQIVAGTSLNMIYYSDDSGLSFSKLSSRTCYSMTSSYNIEKIACISGDVDEYSKISYSYDKGMSWKYSHADKDKWMGIVSNQDFSYIVAVKTFSKDYVYVSKDYGKSFALICDNERNRWGCLKGSNDLSTMILTDIKSKNVHVSEDYGLSWKQIFNANGELGDNHLASIGDCFVTKNGENFALGFKDATSFVIHDCLVDEDEDHCAQNWNHQKLSTSTGQFDNRGVALSNDGKYFYSVDAGTMEIAVGSLVINDDDAYDDDYSPGEIEEELEEEEEEEVVDTVEEASSDNGDDFEYLYVYKDISTDRSGEPVGVYTSKHGDVIITGDNAGNVWISTSSGVKWKHSYLNESDGSLYITGCVISSNGKEMIVSTNEELIYHTKDYGETFSVRAYHKCSIMASSEDLENIICIGGDLGDLNSLLISYDKGSTWKKSETPPAIWMGIASNEDFSHIVAIKKYTFDYVWKSSDKGVTFKLIANNEKNEWGDLCASRSLSVLVLTDYNTLNSHVSVDYGQTWHQIFCHQGPSGDERILVNGTVNACSVSYDGASFALGFTGGDLYVIHNCQPADDQAQCESYWRSQNTTIDSYHDTRGVALSVDGTHFYSVDGSTMEIASGELYKYPTFSPTPLIPTVYIPTIWSPSPFPTKKPTH